MPEPRVVHSTFVLERSFRFSAERVFAAFSDPASKRRWFAELGRTHDVEAFEMDFRVGGLERIRYRFREGTPFPGLELHSNATFLDIVPGKRIVMSATMELAGHRFSASLLTVEILEAGGGSELVLTHQGAFFEHSDGPAIREAGWVTLLDQLREWLQQ